MIDRDQLTEARRRLRIDLLAHAGFTPAEVEALDDAARLLLDFPTDTQVEAVAKAIICTDDGAGKVSVRAALEAVRRTMIGDTDG